MSKPCTRCRNYGINEHHHGRIVGTDSDLCDVCYWRKRAEDDLPKEALRYRLFRFIMLNNERRKSTKSTGPHEMELHIRLVRGSKLTNAEFDATVDKRIEEYDPELIKNIG